jgi:hypothetical protein
MRGLFLLAALAAITGCASLNPVDPQQPDTVGGQARAEQAREAVRSYCGADGQVRQRDDTGGTSAADYQCERRDPR